MVKIFGVIFIALLIAAPISALDYFVGSGFVRIFAIEQSSSIIGTLLGLNVATVTYLVSQLISMEKNAGKSLFKNTKIELKHNLYFMGSILITNLYIVSAIPKTTNSPSLSDKILTTGLGYISLTLIVLVIYSVLEIVKAVFSASEIYPE